MNTPTIDNPLHLAVVIVVSLFLMYGIAYNGADAAKDDVDAKVRARYPDKDIRPTSKADLRWAACASVVLLVGAAVICYGAMFAFQWWYHGSYLAGR